LRIGKLEVLCGGNSERQNGQWHPGTQIIFVDENGIRQQGVEALLIRYVAEICRKTTEQSLENVRCIYVGDSRRGARAWCRCPPGPGKQWSVGAVSDRGVERQCKHRMIVKYAVARADNGPAILAGDPCQTDARRDIVRIPRNALNNSERILRLLRNVVYC